MDTYATLFVFKFVNNSLKIKLQNPVYLLFTTIFKKNGEAGAILQNTFVINSVVKSSFSSKSSKHCLSQTVRARERKFLENFHPPPVINKAYPV